MGGEGGREGMGSVAQSNFVLELEVLWTRLNSKEAAGALTVRLLQEGL